MLSSEAYISMSMEYNLFWVRIMKDHAIFIQSSLPAIQKQLTMQADRFRQQFDRLLTETIRLSNGAISGNALQSGQYVTRYTETSEQIVQQFTRIDTASNLTRMEYNIQPYNPASFTPQKEQEVSRLNQNILNHTNALADFKAFLLNAQASCNLFTFSYYADLDHIYHEALRYIEILNKLQNKDENLTSNYMAFWNLNMAQHAKSMRGLFDPTETAYFNEANHFAELFESLMAKSASGTVNVEAALTNTKEISAFKADSTRGLIECKIKAIMSALFTDHCLREANHYIYLLQS